MAGKSVARLKPKSKTVAAGATAKGRVVRVRVDGKLATPLTPHERRGASEVIRERRQRSIGKGIVAKAARERAAQSSAETVARRWSQARLISARAIEDSDDE